MIRKTDLEFKTRDEKRIHAVKMGSGPILVFLIHGLANNWESWQEIAKYNDDNLFTFVAFDLLGFGESDRLKEYSFNQSTEDVIFVMKSYIKANREEIAKTYVGGLSMGSLVTAHIASKKPLFIDGYILMGPLFREKTVRYKKKVLNYLMRFARRERISRYVYEKILKMSLLSYFLSLRFNMHKFDKQLVDRYGVRGKRIMDMKAYIDLGIDTTRYDTISQLRKARRNAEILIVLGKYDKYADVKAVKARSMKGLKYVKNLTVKLVDNAGHIVSYEKPKGTYLAIRDFIENDTEGVVIYESETEIERFTWVGKFMDKIMRKVLKGMLDAANEGQNLIDATYQFLKDSKVHLKKEKRRDIDQILSKEPDASFIVVSDHSGQAEPVFAPVFLPQSLEDRVQAKFKEGVNSYKLIATQNISNLSEGFRQFSIPVIVRNSFTQRFSDTYEFKFHNQLRRSEFNKKSINKAIRFLTMPAKILLIMPQGGAKEKEWKSGFIRMAFDAYKQNPRQGKQTYIVAAHVDDMSKFRTYKAALKRVLFTFRGKYQFNSYISVRYWRPINVAKLFEDADEYSLDSIDERLEYFRMKADQLEQKYYTKFRNKSLSRYLIELPLKVIKLIT